MRNAFVLALVALVVCALAGDALAQCGVRQSSQQQTVQLQPVVQQPVRASQSIDTGAAFVQPQALQLRSSSSSCSACTQTLRANSLARFTIAQPAYRATQSVESGALATSAPCADGQCETKDDLQLKAKAPGDQQVLAVPAAPLSVKQTTVSRSSFRPFQALRNKLSPPEGVTQTTRQNRRGDITQVQKYRAPRG